MVNLPLVLFNALVRRDIRLRRKANARDEPSRVALSAILTLNQPLPSLFVELGTLDGLVILGVA